MHFSESLKRFQTKPETVQLVGFNGNPRFYAFEEQAQKVLSQERIKFSFEVSNLHESDYDYRVKQLKRRDPHFSSQFKLKSLNNKMLRTRGDVTMTQNVVKRPPFLMVNDVPLFSVEELSQQLQSSRGGEYHKPKRPNMSLMQIFQEKHDKSYVFMELEHDSKLIHIIIELYQNLLPRTCQNFIQLCQGTGMSYKNTIMTRVKKNGYIQGGDVGQSIYGRYFEDESFVIKHNEPGIIGMANMDVPHSNGSQFYITLAPMSAYDGRRVAFGRVIVGFKSFQQIAKLQPLEREIPYSTIKIVNCGVHIMPPFKTSTSLMGEVVFDTRFPKDRLDKQLQHMKRKSVEQIYMGMRLKEFGPDSVTLTTFLILEQQKIKEATGDFTNLINTIQYAFRKINSTNVLQSKDLLQFSGIGSPMQEVRRLAISYLVNDLEQNKQCAMLYCLDELKVYTISEENRGKYLIIFRALDTDDQVVHNNSNPASSMFLVYKKQTTNFKAVFENDLKQSGDMIIASGYCLYGQSAQILMAVGFNANIFTFDGAIGEFILSHPKIKLSQGLGVLSVPQDQSPQFDEKVTRFIDLYRNKMKAPFRYSESLYTNFHRVVLLGGICLYPLPTINIYEAMAIMFLIEKVQGQGLTTKTSRCQLLKVNEMDETTQLFFGLPGQIQQLENMLLSINKEE